MTQASRPEQFLRFRPVWHLGVCCSGRIPVSIYPLWKNLDKGVEMVLNGAAPEHAAAAVIQQLSLPQREDGQ